MRNKLFVVAIALMALLLGGTAILVHAQQPGGATSGWHDHHGDHMAWMARELNLTDAQQEQAKKIMEASHETMHPLTQQMEANRQAMMAATATENFDQAKVQALANQQGQLTAQMAMQKALVHNQIYTQVLTPEQRIKAADMMQKHMQRMAQHMQDQAPAPQQ